MRLFGRTWGRSGHGERPDQTAPGSADAATSGEDYGHLDARVSKLLTDFEQRRFGLGPSGAVDYHTCRDAVLNLHNEVLDEASRVALIRFHGALMSSGVDGLAREGRDSSELQSLWREDYYGMLAKEVIDVHGNVDQDALDHVNEREKAQGRLGEGETFQIQRAPSREVSQETGLRAARSIGERAIAVWTLVLRSIMPAQREALLNAFAAEADRHWLTDAELAFLLNEQPDPGDIVAYGWHAERLVVLIWAVGLIELPANDEKCDPMAFATLIPPTSQVSFEAFLGSLQVRDPREIDAVAANINQLYWDAHDAASGGLAVPQYVDLEVLGERLRALVWLLGKDVPDWPCCN